MVLIVLVFLLGVGVVLGVFFAITVAFSTLAVVSAIVSVRDAGSEKSFNLILR